MIGPSTDTARFGGSFGAALAIGQAAGADWYQIYQPDQNNIPKNYVFPTQSLSVNFALSGGGDVGASSGASLPEPSTGVLIVFAAAGFCLPRRRFA
jgi:hypothetical protein